MDKKKDVLEAMQVLNEAIKSLNKLGEWLEITSCPWWLTGLSAPEQQKTNDALKTIKAFIAEVPVDDLEKMTVKENLKDIAQRAMTLALDANEAFRALEVGLDDESVEDEKCHVFTTHDDLRGAMKEFEKVTMYAIENNRGFVSSTLTVQKPSEKPDG